MKTAIWALLIACTFANCAPRKKTSDILNTWIGSTKQQLLLQWGPPTQTTTDGSGGEILVFAHRVYYVAFNQTVDYWEYRMMYVNTDNKIYHWLYRKSPNPPDRVDVRILLH